MLRLATCVAMLALTWQMELIPWPQSVALATLLYLLIGGWDWVRIVLKTLRRDVDYVRSGIRIKRTLKNITNKNSSLCDLFFEQVKKTPEKLAFVSADTGKSFTFQESQQLAIKIANIFHADGYKKGDVIALLMENRIEYLPIWMGLTMIGVVTSLINYNLRGEGLGHCINVCKCKAILFSEEMTSSIKGIENDLDVSLYCFGEFDCGISKVKYVQKLLDSGTSPQLPPTSPEISATDPVAYVYTSGTTGLPKAAIVRGIKCLSFSVLCNVFAGLNENDVIYNALPLYHTNGLIACTNTLFAGCTSVIRKKFSASHYMEDCCKYHVTCINYIGEVCRYLLAQPTHDVDGRNEIRLAMGNGLKASIWKEFQERFHIAKILEVYGSTEGNMLLVNTTGRVGAVGFALVAFSFLNRVKIIKVDKNTGEVIRGSNGLAMEAKPGETGQAVGVIEKKPLLPYDGYLNKADTKKKIAYDIFTKGDSVFLSGDILVKDEEGYFYFQDRSGDTFRWRGENVSTNEIEGVISKALQLVDVVVYGVEVPGEEGRAGMACIHDPERKIIISDLQEALQASLPKYAQPIFLRMTSTIDVTSTFKLQKNKLRDEGFNKNACPHDDFYYFNSKEKKYMSLNSDVYEDIINQSLRF